MDLELRLHPDDAARLPRLPLFAAAARTRGSPLRIVWHDSADATLAAQGLALAQERGAWRLERMIPTSDPWPPGAPPPVLEETADPLTLHHALPTPLAPVAAFAGRRSSFSVDTAAGAVSIGLCRGTLRAVTTEYPACRLHLTGPDMAVRTVALRLVDTVRAEVPRAALAGEAFAAAHGTPPPPRRHGPPKMPDRLGIAESFAFVLGHLTDVILSLAPSIIKDGDGPEPVHQMRVAVRRLRSAIAVFRRVLACPELLAANAGLKALGQSLGATRDWDVFLGETMPAVAKALPDEPRLARLTRAAERHRQERHAALRTVLESAEFRRLGIELAWLAGACSWHRLPHPEDAEPTPSLQGFAAWLLQRRLRKVLNAGEAIDALDAAGLHALRLRAKRMRYAAEIFAPLYPGKAARRFVDRLATLQDRLGVLNDGATAAGLLRELGPRHAFSSGLVLGFVGADRGTLRPRTIRAWEKFRRIGPFWE